MIALDNDEIDPIFPARLLAEPSRTINPVNPTDPARLGYPPTFPIEIALCANPTDVVCAEYGITYDEWDLIRNDAVFLADLKRAMDMLKQEGMSFRVKAKLQAEELLKTSWRTIHDPDTPATVKAQLIQATMRWAQYDTPTTAGAAGGGNAFAINIQFNNER